MFNTLSFAPESAPVKERELADRNALPLIDDEEDEPNIFHDLTDTEMAALKWFSTRMGCSMVPRTLEEILDDF